MLVCDKSERKGAITLTMVEKVMIERQACEFLDFKTLPARKITRKKQSFKMNGSGQEIDNIFALH